MWALVDINAAFCSFIQLFEGNHGKPVVVLSSNQGNAVARSPEAKALGIKMGQPAHEFVGLVRHHGGFVYGSNFALFGSMSNRFHEELEIGGWMYDCQVYSIDESFGRVDTRLMGNLDEHGHRLQQTIQRNLGLGVGVGFGPTRTIAKAANWAAKEPKWRGFTRGVVDLSDPDRQERLFAKMPVGEIWGIGPRTCPQIEAMGIRTALQLRNADLTVMRERFNITIERTIRELRGEDVIALKNPDTPRETICVSRSMGVEVSDLNMLKEAVSSHATTASGKLRRQNSVAGAVTVFIGTSPFAKTKPQYRNSATIKLPVLSQSTEEIVANALHVLTSIYRPGFGFKKVGVILGAIGDSSAQQGDLFAPAAAGSSQVTQAMDLINDKFGRGTVRSARVSSSPVWKPIDDLAPRSFTSRWDEIPVAR